MGIEPTRQLVTGTLVLKSALTTYYQWHINYIMALAITIL